MAEHRAWFVAVVLSAGACGIGCGGTSEASPAATAGSGGTNGGGATTAGSSSGGNATGGAAGTTNGGTTAAAKACTGSFAAPALVFTEDPQFWVNGVSLTGDELELYYSQSVRGTPMLQQSVVRRTRASSAMAFGPATSLLELAGVCLPGQYVNPDISEDGLTLYVSCTVDVPTAQSEGMSPLRVAHRADRNAVFALDAEPAEAVGASAGLSADELTVYADGEIFGNPPQMFTRASKSEKFGATQPVPGLTSGLISLDISDDGLAIFGSANLPPDTGRVLARATRASIDAAFEPPLKIDLQLTGAVGAPNITPACTLYFVYIMPGAPGSSVYAARQP